MTQKNKPKKREKQPSVKKLKAAFVFRLLSQLSIRFSLDVTKI